MNVYSTTVTHLERLGGGIGTRGPGESQDRNRPPSAARQDRHATAKPGRDRSQKRCARSAIAAASSQLVPVGYTNAGKSSLLNRLTQAGALVEDRLFATLDTLTRRLDCGDGIEMLISDTVGFIRRLPHHLVASFHATLEEASRANLLIHVVDASDPLAMIQAESVAATLDEIGIGDLPRIYALNKIDRNDDPGRFSALSRGLTPSFPVSAVTGAGLDQLVAYLKEKSRPACTR